MFQAFESLLHGVPNKPNPNAHNFLPVLEPFKLLVLALGIIACSMVIIKLRQQRKQNSGGGITSLNMRVFMDRMIIGLMYTDIIFAVTSFVVVGLYWQVYHFYSPQSDLVRRVRMIAL